MNQSYTSDAGDELVPTCCTVKYFEYGVSTMVYSYICNHLALTRFIAIKCASRGLCMKRQQRAETSSKLLQMLQDL